MKQRTRNTAARNTLLMVFLPTALITGCASNSAETAFVKGDSSLTSIVDSQPTEPLTSISFITNPSENIESLASAHEIPRDTVGSEQDTIATKDNSHAIDQQSDEYMMHAAISSTELNEEGNNVEVDNFLEGGNSVNSIDNDVKQSEETDTSTQTQEAQRSQTDAEQPVTAEIAEALPPEFHILHFDTNSTEVRADDLDRLTEHARYLMAHATARLVISGHADTRGSQAHNKMLSQKRAAAVAHLLEKMGVNEKQLEIQSFGEEAPARDVAHLEENRRVELTYDEPTLLTKR